MDATSRPAKFRFLLYVAGRSPNSLRAIANLQAVCSARPPGRCHFEVVDVFEQPQRALDDNIFMTPTLIRLAPSPNERVVGTLDNSQVLLEAQGPGFQAP